jgi:hypothetical protein
VEPFGSGLDLEGVVDVGQVVIVEIEFAHNSENFGAFNLLLIFEVDFRFCELGSSPEFCDFGAVGVGFEFVGAIFEYLIKFIYSNAHIILLYNA